MSLINVNSTPEAIYPFGEQDALVITNQGPWTVYVDSDSSCSTNSHPIPATGVMVWDAGRPLWLVAGGDSSTVSITRNTAPSSFTNAIYSTLGVTNKVIAPGTAGVVGPVECSAFSTLQIKLDCRDMFVSSGPITKLFTTRITWYDSAMNLLSVDNYTSYPEAAFGHVYEGTGSRLFIPVRGAIVKVEFQSTGAGSGGATTCTVLGITREMPLRSVFSPGGDAIPYTETSGGQSQYGIDGIDYWDWGAAGFPNLYLPGIAPFLTVSWRSGTHINGAGLMWFVNPLNANLIYARTSSAGPSPIAFDSTDFGSFTVNLPVSQPVKTQFAIPTDGGGAPLTSLQLMLTWRDA